FAVGITRQQLAGEDAAAIDRKFRNLLRKQRLPEDMPVVALPELGLPAAAPGSPALDPAAAASDTASAAGFPLPPPCSRSRMLIRREGKLRLAPCPLVDDAPAFDLPPDLERACRTAISAVHPRCSVCRST